METHEALAKIGPSDTDRRRANMLAAGVAVRHWIHALRTMPIDVGRDVLPDMSMLRVEEDVSVQRVEELEPRPVEVGPAGLFATLPSLGTPRDDVKALWARALELAMRLLRRFWRPAVRWSLRIALGIGATAIVVMALMGAGRTVGRYRAQWKAMPTKGTAVLESNPPGSEVLADGVPVGTTPVTTELTPGHHVIEFKRRQTTRTLEIDVTKGQTSVARLDWNATQVGQVRVRSDPPGARITIEGRFYGVTPLIIDNISVGSHVVVLQKDNGSVRRPVTISRNSRAEVNEAIYSGWLHVASTVELEISEGSRAITLDEQNMAILPPGPHDIRAQNRALGFSTVRHIEVKPGQVSAITVEVSPPTVSAP